MSPRRFDGVSLVAGLVIAAAGGLLLLDQRDSLHISLGVAAALLAAALGVILIATGLGEGDGDER